MEGIRAIEGITRQPLSLMGWGFCVLWILLIHSGCSGSSTQIHPDRRPNILLLVADDLGYADLGCYGGDIHSPNIDSLARRGIRFSRFHTAPMCAPSRAMLLTGNDHHIAGIGRQNMQAGVFGYEGHLTGRVATLPAVLRAAGYHTYMAGKWHLGDRKADNPHQKGFEHSFVLLEGVGNHYSGRGLFRASEGSHYTEDGREVSWSSGAYSTDLYTDKLISYIDRHKGDSMPFFAYAAYTSPHWPLQVDEPYWKKYERRYDSGYEALREARLQSLKKAGMIPDHAVLPPLHPSIPPWDELSPEQKKAEARKMELYAGMVDNLDENIGRIFSYLKDIGEYDHTLVIFMSDNGAAGEDYYNEASLRPYIDPYYSNDYENMGNESSLVSYGPQWAEAGSAPFRYYKEYTANGGVLAPMILAGPQVERQNEIHHGFLSVMDIAPTLYELAGTSYPEHWEGQPLYPMKGTSLLGYTSLTANEIHPKEQVFGLEHAGYAMLRKGQWKITNFQRPFSEAYFELFNLSEDLSERHNLREENPAKFRELLKEWQLFAEEVKVQVPEP